jgi:membrane protease YdiL (CAAX protease family)
MPRPLAWPAVLIGAPAVLAIVAAVTELIGFDEKALEPLLESIEKLKNAIGLPVLLLLPPIAEEVFFRGFLLSGFRRKRNAAVAVVIVAAIFAVFHMQPAKYLPTFLIGLWLGYVVVATGSLWPAILAHLANNSIPLLGGEFAVPVWAPIPAAVVLVGAVLLLERVRRADRGGATG